MARVEERDRATGERIRAGVLRVTAAGLAAERAGRPVFAGISFSLGPGGLLAVTGPNGAGKSTLLRIVAGLLRPASGTLTIAGIDDETPAVHYLGHLDGLKRALSVEENLAFWRRLWGGRGDVAEALAAVGLEHVLTLPAWALSAGQKRRVAVARLLVAPRPIWLLDEPTAGLDAAAEAMLGGLIGDHLRNGGIALAATHGRLPVAPTAGIDLGAGA